MVEPIDRNILIVTAGYNPSDTSYVTDLATAIDQIGSEQKTLVIDGPIVISTAITVPSNILLKITNKESSIIKSGSATLTINGPFEAGLYQVFSGFAAGDVTFGSGSVVEVYPEWWGALGDGSNDDSTNISCAIAAHKRIAFVGNGKIYKSLTTCTLPNADRELVGYGYPTITTSGTNALFSKTTHGTMTSVSGIRFTGGGTALDFSMSDSVSSYTEQFINDCSFIMNSGVWGIKLVGTRRGFITQCHFETGNGIYSSHANFRHIENCTFKNGGTAIQDDGQGSVYSTGSYINNTEIMGYTNGIIVQQCDDFSLTNSTVDYNDNNIQLIGQDRAKVIGNYLGSRTTSPAISLESDTGAITCTKVLIANNVIAGHLEDVNYDAISLSNSTYTKITNNIITFYTRYGIVYSGDTFLLISGNSINPRPTYGTNSVYTASDNGSNKIVFNTFVQVPSVGVSQIFSNYGYATENSGQVQIINPASTAVITHGLGYTPANGDIMITPASAISPATNWWTSSIDATQFVLNLNTAPSGTSTFGWQVRKKITQ